jgi:hypothetical protein
MSWNGTMQCIVTNDTGGPITDVAVSHTWTDDGTQSTTSQSMAQAYAIEFAISVGDGGSDEWTISLVDVSGEMYGRVDKQCDVEEEDYDSGNPVRISLGPLTVGWSVQLPVSSSCTDNYYDDMGQAHLTPSFNWNYAAEVTLSTALSMVPVVGNILSGLVYIFWPSGPDVWTQIEQQTAQLIQQMIDQQTFQQVSDTLSGLQSALNDYIEELATGDLSEIASFWTAADVAFDTDMPSFQEPGYELLLLPLFAQVVNLDLSLLRDGVLFGASWGWNSAQVQLIQTKLTNYVTQYSQWANQWYQSGYNQVVLATPTDYHECQPFLSVNQFVRNMTLGVLDFMNLWPYLDPSQYSNPIMPYLDREVYSDPVGTCDNSGAIDLPSPPTQPIQELCIWGADRIDAAQLTYPSGGGPGGVTQTSRMGDQNGGTSQPPGGGVFNLMPSSQVVVAAGLSGDILNAFSFTFADGSDSGQLGGEYPGGGAFNFAYPGETMSSLHINGISDFYGSADCAVFGFKYQNFGQLMAISFDGSAWSADTPVGIITTPAAPGLAVFGQSLYCMHQGDLDATLWYTVFDGTSWLDDQQVANVGMSEAPGVAEFNSQLYAAHQGWGGRGQLWYSVFDGTSWAPDTQVAGVGMTASPSLAVYNGLLYCFHQGGGGDGRLWYSVFDGTSWAPDAQVAGVGMTAGPSAVVYNGQLYCFYQGSNGEAQLWFTQFDGTNWSAEQLVGYVGISESPSAVVLNDSIYVLHKGWGTSTQLWYSVFDGTGWQPDQLVPSATLASSPAGAVVNGVLYCLHEGQGQAPGVEGARILSVASPAPMHLDRFAALPGFRSRRTPDVTTVAAREQWADQRAQFWHSTHPGVATHRDDRQ